MYILFTAECWLHQNAMNFLLVQKVRKIVSTPKRRGIYITENHNIIGCVSA